MSGQIALEKETGDEPIVKVDDPARPKSFGEALRKMKAEEAGGDDAAKAADEEIPDQGDPDDVEANAVDVEANAEKLMAEFADLGMLPASFASPKGKTPAFMKFPADMTETPWKGDRYCVLWTLSYADEKRAIARSGGQPGGMIPEMTQGMIRVIDGKWTAMSGRTPTAAERFEKVSVFWEEIGPGCRQVLETFYINQHNLSMEQKARFFTECVAFRSVAESPKAPASGLGTAPAAAPTLPRSTTR